MSDGRVVVSDGGDGEFTHPVLHVSRGCNYKWFYYCRVVWYKFFKAEGLVGLPERCCNNDQPMGY